MTREAPDELEAAASHCIPGCSGPTAHQLAGLAAPHSCRDTLAAGTADAFRQVASARRIAVELEQRAGEAQRLLLEETAEHPAGCRCGSCVALAVLDGSEGERLATLAELNGLQVDADG